MSLSVKYLCENIVETQKNHIRHLIFEYLFKQGKSRWNGCLARNNHFESVDVKMQQRKLVELRDVEKHACTMLLKSYQNIENEELNLKIYVFMYLN